ncbi:hypothetical protein TNCV_3536331 [Trichonephila clavipes]|uniref:Uncharacterized protein n=1 Tax=Trichonephila clavipes TaxID=2585209 RepID=A0A8X7BAF9_TRICX|nr:hypothetical protein TNCV_3536331 [Trichonephila clavipes]
MYLFLLPNCILKDFTRANILDCPVGTKLYVHGVYMHGVYMHGVYNHVHGTVSPFIRTNDGFLFDVSNSCQESMRLVWNYAYPNKSWILDPKTFDKFLATGYLFYPFLQLKTLKATIFIGSEHYMKGMDGTEEESSPFFNKNGI